MFTPDEKRAILFLGAVAAAGGLLRVVRTPGHAPGAAIVAPELAAGDIARQAQLARRAEELARPLRPGELVDVDRSEAAELQRLPRVGPGLARRIVQEREAHGPFGSLEGLSRVSGMGPGTLRGLEGKVAFSGSREPGAIPSARTEGAVPGSRLPAPGCSPEPVSINTATVAQLDCLPTVGPALAARIVTFRTAHGLFREVKELQQVPGIGEARVARLTPYLRAP